jgi:hypothetical protein
MKTTFRYILLLTIAFSLCAHFAFARGSHPSLARRLTPEEKLLETVQDTLGLGVFLDSLQADLDKGRLQFFLDHVGYGFNGHNLACCGGEADLILRQDSAYAKSMAQVLAWHLVKRKIFLQNPLHGVPVVVARICAEEEFPFFDGKKPKNPDAYSVYLEDLARPLLDSIGGRPIGKVGMHWVKPLKQVGGHQLYKFKGKIGVKWMKVQTPDGRIGWVDAWDLRDAKGPGADIGLEHQRRGWWIYDLARWDDIDDEDP